MRVHRFFASAVAVSAVVAALTAIAAQAETPKANNSVKGLGNSAAPQGGTFFYNLGVEPTTLNPITGTDLYNQYVQAYVMDTLMNRNYETYDWDPGLAEKVERSKDGREFTFTIRQGAKWSDGKPLTVEDVKFSFDVIFDDKYNAAHLRPYYENIEKAEILGPNVIKFVTKSKFFGNFDVIANLTLVPKHVYGDAAKGSKMNKTILGSGPYVLKEYRQGQSIILERNKNWWGNAVPEQRGRYNFQTIRMRFDKEENLVLERLKKGELDYDALTPEAFSQKTNGAPWGTTVLKKQVENLQPKPYGYIGWNMTKDMFKDKRVRRALAHLMNRDEMNRLFRFGMSLPATGPWYQQSDYADPKVKAIAFDPKKAGEMLKAAGWTDSNKDGVLDKGGQPFEFTLFYANRDTQKYWVLYQEDLKKAGIRMNLQLLEWNALLKNL
ncbi:MAG: ABC transporter substrate-binding protein, partial [Bdellovibrionales bacterium]|nr:ABC transporter substrate-binding protein [Bdellovibrionales bacterium]